MFARRLTLALAALACAAMLEGVAAMWALSVANDHVLRGRVASDIQVAFKDLTVLKLRQFEIGSHRPSCIQPPPPSQR